MFETGNKGDSRVSSGGGGIGGREQRINGGEDSALVASI